MNAYTLAYISLLLTPFSLFSSTITLRLRPYPTTGNIITNLKKPGVLAHHTLKKITPQGPITGIFATYAGFLEASSNEGFITFPRKNTDPLFTLLVTTQLTPIVMFEQTLQNWETIPGIATSWYRIERLTDPETELTYWQVEKSAEPQSNAIPLDAIVIIAEPTYVYVPTGITLTNTGPNLVLPTLYTRPELNIIENSLYILKLAHLFKPANVLHIKQDVYYAEQFYD